MRTKDESRVKIHIQGVREGKREEKRRERKEWKEMRI